MSAVSTHTHCTGEYFNLFISVSTFLLMERKSLLAAATLMIECIPPTGAPTESLFKKKEKRTKQILFCIPAAMNYKLHVTVSHCNK